VLSFHFSFATAPRAQNWFGSIRDWQLPYAFFSTSRQKEGGLRLSPPSHNGNSSQLQRALCTLFVRCYQQRERPTTCATVRPDHTFPIAPPIFRPRLASRVIRLNKTPLASDDDHVHTFSALHRRLDHLAIMDPRLTPVGWCIFPGLCVGLRCVEPMDVFR